MDEAANPGSPTVPLALHESTRTAHGSQTDTLQGLSGKETHADLQEKSRGVTRDLPLLGLFHLKSTKWK